jgi:hypothetical protein
MAPKESHLVRFIMSKEAKKQIAAFLKVSFRALYRYEKQLPEDAFRGQLLISNFLMPEVLSATELKKIKELPLAETPQIEDMEEEAPAPKAKRRKMAPRKERATKRRGRPRKAVEEVEAPPRKKIPSNMLSANEAADYLQINRNLLGYHTGCGNLKCTKIGSRLYFDTKELDRFKSRK